MAVIKTARVRASLCPATLKYQLLRLSQLGLASAHIRVVVRPRRFLLPATFFAYTRCPTISWNGRGGM